MKELRKIPKLVIDSELIHEVLQLPDSDIVTNSDIECRVMSFDINGNNFKMNVFEFIYFHCKSWALEQGYSLFSAHAGVFGRCIINNADPKFKEIQIDDISEVASIIKACNWIMNTTDTSDKDNDNDIILNPLDGIDIKGVNSE